MLSKKDGDSYIALEDGERFPVKMGIHETDAKLKEIKESLETLQGIISDAYHNDENMYKLLKNEVFRSCSYFGDIDDGKCGWLEEAIGNTADVMETLAGENDEIPTEEEIITLEDLGYKQELHSKMWEKKIEDTEEKEVVDEVWLLDNPVHRIRTTLWQKTDYGRASKSITYKEMDISKKLAAAVGNSRKEAEK